MPEDMKLDPPLDKLARFTPSTGGLDRDALLFEAGRASAPRPWRWKLATATLAVTQMLTLTAWLTTRRPDPLRPTPPPSPVPGPVEPMPEGSFGKMAHWLRRGEVPPPEPIDDPLPSRPVLSIADSRDWSAFD